MIKGGVPARDIRRLLKGRPDAIGLAVPEIPLDFPGMDFGDQREAHDIFLIRKNGLTEVFASYPSD